MSKKSLPPLENISGVLKWACLTPATLDLKALRAQFHAWSAHNHGALPYIDSRQQLLLNPFGERPWAKAAIVVAFAPQTKYDSPLRLLPPAAPGQPAAMIAAYALTEDYHLTGYKILREIVNLLQADKQQADGADFELCVDSRPVLEKLLALQAGIGHLGRNCLLRVPPWGSLAHLAILFTSLPLPSKTLPPNHDLMCQNCQACQQLCPNQALTANGITVRKCRAWIANEKRGELTAEEKFLLGDALAGCSHCSMACPDTPTEMAAPLAVDAREIINMSSNKLKKIIAGTALTHLGTKQLKRNAAAAIENAPQN